MDYIAEAVIVGCIFVSILDVEVKGDWVEIPPLKPSSSAFKVADATYYTETKTPVDVIFSEEQIGQVEAHNTSTNSAKLAKSHMVNAQTVKNRITAKPAKSSVLEVFVSTTHFTPLMSSIDQFTTNQPTTISSVSDAFTAMLGDDYQESYVEVDSDEKTEIPVDSVSNFGAILPFLKTIQDTLMQNAHRSIRSKVQVLRDLKDGLLFEIDQRLTQLWSPTTNTEARGYDDSHVEFPSNEGALMTIGFLTLAVFLVKLVLQVITAVKAKKTYYNTTITTFGRRRRSITPDLHTTYILSAIEKFNLD